MTFVANFIALFSRAYICSIIRQNCGRRPNPIRNPISNPKSYPKPKPNPIPNPKPNPKCYRNMVRSSPTVLPYYYLD